MKKTITFILCLVLLAVPLVLNALPNQLANNTTLIKNAPNQSFFAALFSNYPVVYSLVGAALVLIAFAVKKYLGFDISNQQIEKLRIWITNLITDAEENHKNIPGIERQKKVVSIIEEEIGLKDRKKLIRNFGSISNAVEDAYQKSHLPTKGFWSKFADIGLDIAKTAGTSLVGGFVKNKF